jgi:hypothetical protein
LPNEDGIGRIYYLFKVKSCSIGAFYLNGTISRVVYTQKTALKDSIFSAFLFGNAPEVVWIPLMDAAENGWVARANSKLDVGLN